MSDPRRTCAVVLPVYNEERAIQGTLARLRATLDGVTGYRFEILCVDDGSSDGTAALLAGEAGITVLTHPFNRGYGAALRTALDRATQEWVLIVDADGTYPIEDLPRFLAEAERGAEMVVGSRRGAGIERNPFRVAARWVLRKMVHVLTRVMVPDLNSGMRLFRRDLYLDFRHLLPHGFSFTTTLTVASLFSGHRIQYLPIEYAERIGVSSIKPIQDFFWFTVLIIRLATYFEPLRFFLPLTGVLALAGIGRVIRDLVVTDGIGSLAVIFILGALQVFITGIIADVLVRKASVAERAPRTSRLAPVDDRTLPLDDERRAEHDARRRRLAP